MNPFVIMIGVGLAAFVAVAVVVGLLICNWDKWFKKAAPVVKRQVDKFEDVADHWEKTFEEDKK